MTLTHKIKNLFEKNILLTWAISYFAVFIIPFCCNIYIYFKSETVMKGQITVNESHSHEAALISLDKLISSNFPLISSIENLIEAEQLTNVSSFSADSLASSIRISKALSKQVQLSENIEMLYIYFPKTDYIISDNNICSAKDFYAKYFINPNLDYETWHNKIAGFNYANYFVANGMVKSDDGFGGNPDIIDFYYSMPLRIPQKELVATLGIRYSASALFHHLEQYIYSEDKNIYAVDKNNQVVIKKEAYPESRPPEYSGYPANGTVSEDKFLVICSTSELLGWKLISKIPKSVIRKKIYYIRFLTVISSLLCFVIVSFLIMFFTNKNYRPFKKAISMVKHGKGDGFKNEYELINALLSDYQSKKRQIIQLQNSAKSSMRTHFLSDLLNGKAQSYPNLSDELSKHEIEFKSDYFAVVIFNIINAEKLFSNDEFANADDIECNNTISFIIQNVFEEIISEKNSGVVFEYGDFNVSVVSFDSDRLEYWDFDIKEAVDKTVEFIQKNFEFSLNASTSNLHKNIYELKEAYAEAMQTLSYRSIIRNSDVNFYSALDKNISSLLLTNEKSQQLESFIKLGNSKISESILSALLEDIDENQSKKNIDLFIFKLCSVVIDAVTATSDEENISDLSPLLDDVALLTSDTEPESIRKERLFNLVSKACEIAAIHAKEKEKHMQDSDQISENKKADDLIINIKEFIKENYNDHNLNVALIGQHFDITPYYISNIFKSTEKTSILSYIQELRISASKELIANTKKPISEISESVGFNSVRTFMRTFTKFEGITPGQYREMQKNSR